MNFYELMNEKLKNLDCKIDIQREYHFLGSFYSISVNVDITDKYALLIFSNKEITQFSGAAYKKGVLTDERLKDVEKSDVDKIFIKKMEDIIKILES